MSAASKCSRYNTPTNGQFLNYIIVVSHGAPIHSGIWVCADQTHTKTTQTKCFHNLGKIYQFKRIFQTFFQAQTKVDAGNIFWSITAMLIKGRTWILQSEHHTERKMVPICVSLVKICDKTAYNIKGNRSAFLHCPLPFALLPRIFPLNMLTLSTSSPCLSMPFSCTPSSFYLLSFSLPHCFPFPYRFPKDRKLLHHMLSQLLLLPALQCFLPSFLPCSIAPSPLFSCCVDFPSMTRTRYTTWFRQKKIVCLTAHAILFS